MEKLKLIRVNNPFDRDSRETLERNYTGESVKAIVDDVFPELTARVVLNGVELPEGKWEFTTIANNDKLILVPHVGKGNQILQIVAIIVIAIVSYGVGAAAGAWALGAGYSAGAAGAWGAAASAAVNIAGGLLMGMLFTPDTPEGIKSLGQSYSWNPVMTQRQGLSIPAIYGEMRIKSGNIISAHREHSHTSPELNTLISYGRGPIVGFKDIIINNQVDLPDSGITLHQRLGKLNQTAVPNFNISKTEISPNSALTAAAGEYSFNIPVGTEGIEVDIVFPSGCYRLKDNGHMRTHTASFNVSLDRLSGGSIPFSAGTISGTTSVVSTNQWSFGEYLERTVRTTKKVYWKEYAVLANPPTQTQLEALDANYPNAFWRYFSSGTEITYATTSSPAISFAIGKKTFTSKTVKITKLNPAETYTLKIARTNGEPESGTSLSYLAAIRYITYAAFTYPKTALLGLQGIASDKVSGSLAISPVVIGRYVQYWTGTAWTVGYTQNPAWICYDILTQPVLDNDLNILRYDGMLPSKVNTADFITWAAECDQIVAGAPGYPDEKLFTFNGIYDGASSTWDAATKVANNFRAFLYYTGIEVKCAVYRYIDTPEQVFTESNILPDSFSQNFASWEDRATEIEVSFMDESKVYEITTLTVLDAALTQKKNKLGITAFGTTKASQAWRIAKFMLLNNKYTHRTITFTADIDSLDCQIGSVIAFQHTLPNWGFGGRVVSSAATTPEEVVLEGIVSDEVFLELGFNQTEIDAFTDSTIDVRNFGAATGVKFQHRDEVSDYHSYDTHGGGVRAGNTVLLLGAGVSWEYAPTQGDVYALSLTNYTSTKEFRIISIAQESDFSATIAAVEYHKELFAEVDGIVPEVDVVDETYHALFPAVTNITASDTFWLDVMYTRHRTLNISWVIPDNPYYDRVNVYYQTISNAGVLGDTVLAAKDVYGASVTLSDVPDEYSYKIYIQTINIRNDTATFSLSPYITHVAAGVLTYANPLMAGGVTNLTVVNTTGDGYTFAAPDCILGWDNLAASGYADLIIDDEDYKAQWLAGNWLSYYQIVIKDASTLAILETYTTKDNKFIFTLEMNRAIGIRRTFIAEVTAVDMEGNVSIVQNITPINPQAGVVSNVSLVGIHGGIDATWDSLGDTTIAAYEIHANVVQGFSPSPTTLIKTVSADTLYASMYLADGMTYVRVGAYDIFGTDNMVYSTEQFVDINHEIEATSILDFFAEISKLYRVPVQEGDSWSVSGGNTLTWNAHTMYYNGVKYSIAAGNTTDPYVYWDIATPTVYLTTAIEATFNGLDRDLNQWQIAKNYGTAFELAWNAVANAVIGTAMIGDAAIENAQIGNIIESHTFNYVPGVSAEGWRLDKNGDITAKSITIIDENGDPVIVSGVTDWADILDPLGTKPADNADITNYDDLRVTNLDVEGDILTIVKPIGAAYSTIANVNGALVIQLPQSWTSTKMKFIINVFQATANSSFTLEVAGFNNSATSAWEETSVSLVGSTAADNRVRFAHDGVKCCIIIGDTSNTWVDPKITVRDLQAGHLNFAKTDWDDAWNVIFTTSLIGYTTTSDYPDALVDSRIHQITVDNISTYIASAAISEAYVADLAVSTAKIQDAAIETLKIAGTAVTIPAVLVAADAVISSSNLSYTTPSLYFEPAGGGYIVTAAAWCEAIDNDGRINIVLEVSENSPADYIEVRRYTAGIRADAGSDVTWEMPVPITFGRSGFIDDVDIRLRFEYVNATVSVFNPTITALGAKR